MNGIHYHLKRWRFDNPTVVDTGEVFGGQAEALERQRKLSAISVKNHIYVVPCQSEACKPKGEQASE